MAEFDLIYNIINQQSLKRDDVVTGIGDDCAILTVPAGHQLAVSMDTLVSGIHFPENTSAFAIGYKALAVNLSDLASSGATPAWVTLSLTMPAANETWLKEFMRGFYALANLYKVQLIGGDTASGPLSITVQAHGFVKQPVLRSGAKAGNLVYVTGTLGDAALGLRSYQTAETVPDLCKAKLDCPQPRVEAGKLLAEFATSMIDISDGLSSDLQHICTRSHCGAKILLHKIPLSEAFCAFFNNSPDRVTAITFGDDYELCFTCDEKDAEKVRQISSVLDLPITCIGRITAAENIFYEDEQGEVVPVTKKGFEHFS